MKTKSLISLCLGLAISAFFMAAVAVAQEQKPEVKVSEAEMKALNAINAMTDANARLVAVEDFIKKYPKSPVRVQLADAIAGEIAKIKDATQAITLAEKAQTIFTTDEEKEAIVSVLLDSYVVAGRADDVFRVGGALIAKNPEDVHAHVQMTFIGANEVRKENAKFVQQALQSGLKAIALIEADKKPVRMDAAGWTSHKALLPQLYQQVAILNLVAGNGGEARTRAVKATVLGPTDPTNFALLGMVINNDYMALATKYKTMPEGADKTDTLKKLEGLIDEIIDAYAHAVALAIGKPEHQPMMQQLTIDLTSYYKYRHNGSTDGLQQLIDKYKPTP
jgi:hypothetical protein